uniref:Uncharacterized protein n=1 Tax=Anguilla anguilla TaxID=7936 RepID=A0A0E9TQF0_ANGAN
MLSIPKRECFRKAFLESSKICNSLLFLKRHWLLIQTYFQRIH